MNRSPHLAVDDHGVMIMQRFFFLSGLVAILAAGCGPGNAPSAASRDAAQTQRAVRDVPALSLNVYGVYCSGSAITIDEGSTTLDTLAAAAFQPSSVPGGMLQYKPLLETAEPAFASGHSSYPGSTLVEVYFHVTFASGAMYHDQCGGA
jgi:hypothetical protein